MRVAITGATGFVGGRLARMLRDEGHDVVALVRSPARAGGLGAAGVALVEGDLDDPTGLERLLDGADGLFHVAGWYKLGSRDAADAWRVNVAGTRRILGVAQRSATPRVVYTSTLAVNSDTRGVVRDETFEFGGRHLSVYDATKAEAHRIAMDFAAGGLPVVVVMSGLVYGPGDTSQTGDLVRAVLRGQRVLVPSTGRFCWGYVDDVARGHLLAMERGRPGEAYMLAGPQHGLAEALGLAASLGNGRSPVRVPGALLKGLAPVADALRRILPLPPEYAGESLRSGAATYLGSPVKAERELAWSARPLAEGMAATVAALRAERAGRT